MSTRTEVTEMTEDDVRVQFTDVFCSDCGASARMHGLHGSTWKRGGPCAGTWIGVVRRALEPGKAQVTIKLALCKKCKCEFGVNVLDKGVCEFCRGQAAIAIDPKPKKRGTK